METRRIAFNLSAKKADLMERAERISYRGKTLDMWFAINLYRAYVATEGPTNFDVFLGALEKVEGWRVIPFSNKEYTVVSKNERIDSKFIEEIVTDKLENISFTLTSSDEDEDESVHGQKSKNRGDEVATGNNSFTIRSGSQKDTRELRGAPQSTAVGQQSLKSSVENVGLQANGGKKGEADIGCVTTSQNIPGNRKNINLSSEKASLANGCCVNNGNLANQSNLKSTVPSSFIKARQVEKTGLRAPNIDQKEKAVSGAKRDENARGENVDSLLKMQDKEQGPTMLGRKRVAEADDFFSDDEERFVGQPAKKIVSVLNSDKTDQREEKKSGNQEDPVKRLRNGIIDAFGEAFVIPVANFHTMMQEKHGIAIDYKKAPCKIPFHKHASLSKLLSCYSDILELKTFRNVYAVLKVPAAAKRIEKLEAAFLFPTDDRLFKLGVEMLITSMFPVKVLIPMDDLVKLVKTFYSKLSELNVFSEAFINRLKSPNVTPLQSGTIRSVNIIPYGNEKYKRWCKEEDHDRLQCLESLVRKSEKIMLSDVSTTSSGLFGDNSEALKIADLNIPKILQLEKDLQMGKSCVVGSSLWMYLRHSVNFDGKETFFFP